MKCILHRQQMKPQLARIAELKDRSISQIWLIVVPTAVVILLALFLIWFFLDPKKKIVENYQIPLDLIQGYIPYKLKCKQ